MSASPQSSQHTGFECPIRAASIPSGPPSSRRPIVRELHIVPNQEWRELRRKVITRDSGRCYHCGLWSGDDAVGPDGRTWHVDHLLALARGGRTELDNLVLSCGTCNAQKGAALPNAPWKARAVFLHGVENERAERLNAIPAGYFTGPRKRADATRDAIWTALIDLFNATGTPLKPSIIAHRAGYSTCAVMHHLRYAALNGHAIQYEKPIRFAPAVTP